MNFWLALLIAACVADIATTAMNLKAGGKEINLLPAALIAKVGFWPVALGSKAIMIGFALWIDQAPLYVCLAALNAAAAVYSFMHRANKT
jgi:hypothetical protein